MRRVTSRSPETSPQTYARVGGMLYLFIIVAALFGEVFVRGSLVVPRDPTATANNILGSEMLFRVGLAGEMLTCACDVALAMILYFLLKPVSRYLALLAAFFRLTFVAIYCVAKLFEIAALAALGGAGYLKAFEPQQLHDLAYVSLGVHSLGYGASLLFFGFCSVLLGYLIHQSGYLPRILGALLAIGGVGYVVFSLAQMLAPAFAAEYLFPWIMLPAFLAELGLALWLIAKGVDIPKWEERAHG
jgi:Domain of unknown function (DUF4386)